MDSRKERQKKGAERGKQKHASQEFGRLGLEICLNGEDGGVVLYRAEAETELLMGYHPQRRVDKCRLSK